MASALRQGAVVTTWETRHAGTDAQGATRPREQFFRVQVSAEGSSYHVWRSFAQAWELQEDLATLFPGFQPVTMKMVSDLDVRSKLAQVFIDCILSHVLLSQSPPVRRFLLPTDADASGFRVLQKSSLRAECDGASATAGTLKPGACVTALEQRRQDRALQIRVERGWVSQTASTGDALMFHESDAAVSKALPGTYRVLRRTTIYRGPRKTASNMGTLYPGDTIEVHPGPNTRDKTLAIKHLADDCWVFLRNDHGALRLLKERDAAGEDGVDYAPATHEGWLCMKGVQKGASFHKRWFALRGEELFYSATPGSHAKGVVALSGCKEVRISEARGASQLEIEVIVEDDRAYRLLSENQESFDRWMDVLRPFAPEEKDVPLDLVVDTKLLTAPTASKERPPADGTVTIDVISCSKLLAADSGGTSDPFVRLKLGKASHKTKVKKKTLDPQYGESFTFPIPIAKDTSAEESPWTLAVAVMDKDKGAHNDFIGGLDIPLTAVFAGDWGSGTAQVNNFPLADEQKLLGEKELEQITRRLANGNNTPYGSITLGFRFVDKVSAGEPTAKDLAKEDADADGVFGGDDGFDLDEDEPQPEPEPENEDEEDEDANFWSWHREPDQQNQPLALSTESATGVTLDSETILVVEEVVENQRNSHSLNDDSNEADDRYSPDALLPRERDGE